MSVYHIAYDLNQPGQSYATLIAALQKAGAKKVLLSGWLLRSSASAGDLRDWVMKLVDTNDRVFVTEATNWAGYNILARPDQI